MITERIPLEVIVKYNERGQIMPVKIVRGDEMFIIDKVYNIQDRTPKGSFGVAIEYKCLIKGKRKSIYFDRYNSVWFVEHTRYEL